MNHSGFLGKWMFLLALCLAPVSQALGGRPFWLGADVSGATMNEKMGHKLLDAQGKECEEVALMKAYGLNAIRLRIWVNPKNGWCSKEDQLVLALRAKKLGMPVMISFHYSDTWADRAVRPSLRPGKAITTAR